VLGRLLTHTWRRRAGSRIDIAVVSLVGLTLARALAEPISDVDLPTPTDIPATLTFAEIRQGRLDAIGRIKALYAEFTQLCRFSGPHERAEATIPFTFHRNAFKGERRFVFRRRLEYPYHGDLEADIAAAPGLGEDIRVYDGDVQQCYAPYGLARAAVYAGKDGSADAQVYAHALSLPIADGVRSARSEIRAWGGWLPDVYDLQGLKWVVEPKCERVDGRVCHVIAEPTLGRRQWIDAEAGYVVRFEEAKQRKDPWRPAGDDIEIRTKNSDFKEVATGIWLPFHLRSVTYAVGASREDNRGSIVSGDDVVAVRLAVNEEIPDSLFALRFRPGTIVTDEIRHVVYVVGTNGEELDPESDAGRRLFEGNVEARSTMNWRPSIWLWVNATVVASLAGLVLMRILRNRRQAAGFR
jgi:hypothetical protein